MEIVFAKDVYGNQVSYPLGKGHFLMAGSTGAGKSGVVSSFLYFGSEIPYVQFLGFDLKMVELNLWMKRFMYVCKSNDQVEIALVWANAIMDERYEFMDSKDMRSWDISCGPYLILVVDELAETMAVDKLQGKDANEKAALRAGLLERIARLGRAAGLHLLSCTQRPSQKVLPEQYRDQHAYRLCLAVRESTTGAMVLGSRYPGYDPRDLGFETPGRGYFLGTKSVPDEVRAYFIDDDTAKDQALRYSYLTMTLPQQVQGDLDRAGKQGRRDDAV